MQLPIDIDSVKGFLAPEEGRALFDRGVEAGLLGPCLEIGSYCGKSTVYLGSACKTTDNTLYAIDHHRGSEEHQAGEAYHDPTLVDERLGVFDTFGAFRSTLGRAHLEQNVVPIVAPSAVAGRHWRTPLGLVFIDGGHSMDAAVADYETWSPHVVAAGLLLIHDVFPDPRDGGRPPFEIYQRALASGHYEQLEMVETLAILKKI
ncbi:MAG: class I SAM-dependent methyltransferase [Pseudomonadales bacterium]